MLYFICSLVNRHSSHPHLGAGMNSAPGPSLLTMFCLLPGYHCLLMFALTSPAWVEALQWTSQDQTWLNNPSSLGAWHSDWTLMPSKCQCVMSNVRTTFPIFSVSPFLYPSWRSFRFLIKRSITFHVRIGEFLQFGFHRKHVYSLSLVPWAPQTQSSQFCYMGKWYIAQEKWNQTPEKWTQKQNQKERPDLLLPHLAPSGGTHVGDNHQNCF